MLKATGAIHESELLQGWRLCGRRPLCRAGIWMWPDIKEFLPSIMHRGYHRQDRTGRNFFSRILFLQLVLLIPKTSLKWDLSNRSHKVRKKSGRVSVLNPFEMYTYLAGKRYHDGEDAFPKSNLYIILLMCWFLRFPQIWETFLYSLWK